MEEPIPTQERELPLPPPRQLQSTGGPTFKYQTTELCPEQTRPIPSSHLVTNTTLSKQTRFMVFILQENIVFTTLFL